MTTVADGLFQYGGMPVGPGGFNATKLFAAPNGYQRKGRAWFVDTSYGGSGNGRSPDRAFSTMQAAFNAIASGDVIYTVGKITEQLVTPVQIFDVTIVGCGNRPRHADATPAGGSWAASSWAAPAAPVAATPLLKVMQQGWRVMNMLFACPADAAGVLLFRNGGAGDAERDASHFHALGCRFDGGQNHIEQSGGCAFVRMENNLFRGATAVSIKDTAGAGIGTNLCWQVLYNQFQDNHDHIIVALNQGLLQGNLFGKFTTKSVDLTGGGGYNILNANALSGVYSIAGGYIKATANDLWGGNMYSGGITAAQPA